METTPATATSSTAAATPVVVTDPVAPTDTETPLESLASICTLLVSWLFIIGFIFQNFEIPSPSMVPALLIGDHVLVDRVSFAPKSSWMPLMHYRPIQHGDIIVFNKPNPEQPDLILVKRAMGLPGDHIHLRNGVVYRNGVPLDEPYAVKPSTDPSSPDAYVSYRDDFPSDLQGIQASAESQHGALWAEELPSHIQGDDIVVPPGKIFAMGDNRPESLDSRFWGFVPQENILGRPLFVYWSFQTPADQIDKTSLGERIGFMGHVLLHIFDETRWKRTLHIVK